MATWMVWTLAIPLIVIAFSFFLLMLTLLFAAVKVIIVLRDIEDKLLSLNPICRTLYRLGSVIDEKVEEWSEGRRSRSQEIVDCVLSVFSIFKRFRRKS